MAFDRQTELFIGIFKDNGNTEQQGYLIDSLHYEFDITRSTEFYKDSATFTVYNPNDDTINEIMNSGVSVIFKAGYRTDGMGVIFVGQVGTVYTETDGPEEKKVVIVCNSQRGAQYQLQRTFMTAFFDEGQSYYDVLKAVADYVGVPLSGAEKLKANTLDCGYYVNGDIRSVVQNFVAQKLRALGGKVIISNNEMIYLDKSNDTIFETAYLNYSTGLIRAEKKRDERFQSSEDAFSENQEYYLGLKAMGDKEVAERKAAEAKIQPKNIIEFEALIHPGIQIGTPIYVDARKSENDHVSVIGKYYVTSLNFKGDNFCGRFSMSGTAEEKVTK